MVTTRYSDQQGSKSRQKVMRLYKRWHRPISKRFIKPPYSIREQPRSTRNVVAYPRPAFSAKNRKNYAPTSFDQQVQVSQGHTFCGGLSLSDESFPNGGARGAFAKPPWVWLKPSRSLREAFSEASRSLQRPRRLHEALVKTSRTLRGGATASPLRECLMKAP